MGNKKIDRKEIKEHILKVAKKIFLEKGYLDTSLRDIAREGDITIGRMYVYFKKKEDIFFEIIKPIFKIIEDMTYYGELDEEVVDEKLKDLFSIQRFKSMLYRSADFMKVYRDEMTLAFFKSDGFDKVDIRQKIMEAYTINHAFIHKCIVKKYGIDEEVINKHVINTLGKLYVSIYEQFVIGDMTDEEYEDYVENMANFIYYGNLGALGMYLEEKL